MADAQTTALHTGRMGVKMIPVQAVKDRVSVRDLHATLLHQPGFDHEMFTFPSQGANQRLTNITKLGTKVVKGIMA